MSPKVVKKAVATKGKAVAKPKAALKKPVKAKKTTVRKASAEKVEAKIVPVAVAKAKEPILSSSRKIIEIKKVNRGDSVASMIDLRNKQIAETPELDASSIDPSGSEERVLITTQSDDSAKSSKVADVIERLRGGQRAEAIETKQDDSRAEQTLDVREYDLDEKINFKNLHGRSFNIYRKISISFVVLTGLLIAAIFYFSLVKVDISVVLKKGELKGNSVLTVYGSQAGSTTNSVLGAVKEVEVVQAEEIPTTGTESLGQEVTGTVKIINNYVRNQPLVASTRLLSANNHLLRVKSTVNVPAGGSVDVQVYADKADPAIDVPLGTRLSIPGLWSGIQDKIYAEALEEIKYKELVKHTVTQNDLDSALAAIRTAVAKKADNEIVPTYNAQYSKVLYKIDDASIVTSVNAKVGEEKDKFNVTGKVNVIIVAFNEADAKKIAEAQLAVTVPENKTLLNFNASGLTYELGTYDILNNTAAVNINYSGEVIAKNPSVIQKSMLVGLSADQLKNYLSSLPDVASFKVTFTPGFIGKVPSYTDRIQINQVDQISN